MRILYWRQIFAKKEIDLHGKHCECVRQIREDHLAVQDGIDEVDDHVGVSNHLVGHPQNRRLQCGIGGIKEVQHRVSVVASLRPKIKNKRERLINHNNKTNNKYTEITR